MITRITLFEGRPREGCESDFFDGIEAIMPLWRSLPHAANVRLLRVTATEAHSPPVVLVHEVDYPSAAAMEEALASPEREAARQRLRQVLALFDGRMHHLVTVDTSAPVR